MDTKRQITYLRDTCWLGVRDLAAVRRTVSALCNELRPQPSARLAHIPSEAEMYARAIASAFCDYLGEYQGAVDVLSPCESRITDTAVAPATAFVLTIAAARTYYRRRQFAKAESAIRRTLTACHERHDKLNEGFASFELARVLHRARVFPEARELAHAAIQAFQTALGPSRVTYRDSLCRFLFGSIAYSEGKLKESTTFVSEARAGLGEDLIHIGRLCQLEGRIARAQSRTDKAETSFLDAVGMFKNSHHDVYLSSVHNDLGHLYTRMGRFSEAKEQLDRACQLDRNGVNLAKNLYFQARLRLHAFHCEVSDAARRPSQESLNEAAQYAAQAIQRAAADRVESIEAEANIALARVLLARGAPKPGDSEARKHALRAAELNRDSRAGRIVSPKTEIAFNLVMAECQLADSCPDREIAAGFSRRAGQLLGEVETEFLRKWHARVEATVDRCEDGFRIKRPIVGDHPDLSVALFKERMLFWAVRQAASLCRNHRGGADLGQMAELLGVVRGAVENWLDNWRENRNDKRNLLGVTPQVLEDLLSGIGLPKPRRRYAVHEEALSHPARAVGRPSGQG